MRHVGHPLYSTWKNMRKRCLAKASQDYARYGGRGITICERWSDFEAFVADMGERPAGTSLDRVDNDGPYAPDNCRWATAAQQRANTRFGRYITFQNKTQLLLHWAAEFGIHQSALCHRIRKHGETKAMQMGDKRK